MEEKWKSTNPRDLAYEIATFMGGEWPTRPVRKVQLSLEGAPMECEELMEVTQLNPTLLRLESSAGEFDPQCLFFEY